MGDILEEASALIQCKECPWYKNCVSPIRISPEEVRQQFLSGMPGMPSGGSPASGDSLSRFLSELAAAANNLLLEGCPVFISRLRASPKLAERIKQIMQTWGTGEGTGSAP